MRLPCSSAAPANDFPDGERMSHYRAWHTVAPSPAWGTINRIRLERNGKSGRVVAVAVSVPHRRDADDASVRRESTGVGLRRKVHGGIRESRHRGIARCCRRVARTLDRDGVCDAVRAGRCWIDLQQSARCAAARRCVARTRTEGSHVRNRASIAAIKTPGESTSRGCGVLCPSPGKAICCVITCIASSRSNGRARCPAGARDVGSERADTTGVFGRHLLRRNRKSPSSCLRTLPTSSSSMTTR